MKRSRFALSAALVSALLLAFAGSAFGAGPTEAGNTCAGAPTEGEIIWFGTSNGAGSSLPATVPVAGVISSWKVDLAPIPGTPPAPPEVRLQVLRKTGEQSVKVIGESAPTALKLSSTGDAVTTATTRIPVLPGDLIAAVAVAHLTPKESLPLGFYCPEQAASVTAGGAEGSLSLGEEGRIAGYKTGFGVPVTVGIEPDADGDGFGDLTQDASPGNPFAHQACSNASSSPSALPCPRPSTSPLRAHASVHGGTVRTAVVCEFAASARIAGRVLTGGKELMLRSGAKRTRAGGTTTFAMPLTAAIQTRLAKLPRSRSLRLEILATAPGVEPAPPVTVKLHGEAGRPAPAAAR